MKQLKATLIALTALLALPLSSHAQSLLTGKEIKPLGGAKTWVNSKGNTYTFVVEDLDKLIAEQTNTDNVLLYPQDQGSNGEGDYNEDIETAKQLGIQGFYIDLGSSQEIGTITTTWEGATAKKTNIYMMESIPDIKALPENPTAILELGQVQSNTFAMPEGSKGRYLVFEPVEAYNWGWGVKIRSISAKAPERQVLTSFSISPSIVMSTVETPINFTFLDQNGFSIDKELVNIEVSGNGTYANNSVTIPEGMMTFTATHGNEVLTAIVYVAESPKTPELSDVFVPLYSNANTVNNANVIWQVGYNGNALNLGEYSFDNENVAWSFGDTRCVFIGNKNVNGDWNGHFYPIENKYKSLELDIFSNKTNNGEINFEGGIIIPIELSEGQWNHISIPVYSYQQLNNLSIRFDEKNKCDILVANIYFTEYDEDADKPTPTSLRINVENNALFFGETATISCDVLDQYEAVIEDAEKPQISVEGATFEDNVITAGNEKSTIKVTATLDDITSEITIPVFDIKGYCMNGAIVTSDTNLTDGSLAIDGGEQPKDKGGLYVVVNNDTENTGEHEHWILAKLNRKYNLDIIEAIWEGACPRDYDVYVGETEDNLQKLYSVTGHTQKDWYDRFFGEEMNNVRYIKIITTYNATGYGIKLHDLKAYGQAINDSYPDKVELELLHNYISADEPVSFSATVYDQYGLEMPEENEKVIYECDGKPIKNNEDTLDKSDEAYDIVAYSGNRSAMSESKALVVATDAEAAFDYSELGHEVKVGEESKNLSDGDFNLGTGEYKSIVITFTNPIDIGYVRLNWSNSYPTSYKVTAQFSDKNTRSAGDNDKTLLEVNRDYDSNVAPIDRIFQQMVDGNSFLVGQNALCGNSDMKAVSQITITPTASEGNNNALLLNGIDLYNSDGSINTGAHTVTLVESEGPVDVYNVNGILIRKNVERADALRDLPAGLYIVNGKKVLVK